MKIKKYDYGKLGPIIIWATFAFRENEIENTVVAIRNHFSTQEYSLIAFEVDDWFEQFSIWQSDDLDDKFKGGASQTYEWLEENILNQLRDCSRPVYIMGYSLAGLFALWAITRNDIFSGAISCSGSLWYPDFMEYLRNIDIFDKQIYLSVGGKEANTQDPLMATVLDCTKEASNILKVKNNVKFEMNPGGHFADSTKRLVKGIDWIMNMHY